MGRIAGYVRVSTDDQIVVQQRDAILAHVRDKLIPLGHVWAEGIGWPHADGWYEDLDVSGATSLWSRPGGHRLARDLDAGDIAVFAKLDRGFRSTVDCLTTVERWKDRGVEVHLLDLPLSVTNLSTPEGMVMLTIAAAFAEWERRRIAQRTKEALQAKKRRGLPTGGTCPYGLKKVGVRRNSRFVPDPEMRAAGARIVQLKDELGYTWHRIFFALRKEGLRRRNGREWSWGSILRAYEGEKKLRALTPPPRSDNITT